jgi:hypothetical protein
MNNMPIKLRKELSENPEYKKCTLKKYIPHTCSGKIDWHHNARHAGKNIQEPFAIISICKSIHDLVYKKDFRNRLDWIMINRMTDEDFKKYHKPDWGHKKRWLNKLFGTPKKLN